VLNIDKYLRALRLRRPWLEWKDPTKNWGEICNPCSYQDIEFFYAATFITVGNVQKDPFLGGSMDIELYFTCDIRNMLQDWYLIIVN
jgi:hypothetical protein